MKITLTVSAALMLAVVPARGEPKCLDLSENEARGCIIEHARTQVQQFCDEYPANTYCHRAGREEPRQSRPLDFCARYHLHRQDYIRNGWQYWRCVK